MAKLVALNNQLHQSLRINPDKAEEQIADLHMIPVVISEFLKLVTQFPILFSKNADTGQFVCVTLMGLEEGENLFWQNAQFNSIYTPLNIARQPFFVGQDEQSGDDYLMCIDRESSAVTEFSDADADADQQQAIFDASGQPTAYLRAAQSILAQLIQGEQQTQAFIQQLLSDKLLVPLSLDITYANAQSAKVKGLYSIDEDKLHNLPAAQLGQLNAAGFLQAAYTQLASLGQIYALIERKNKRMATPSPWFKASGE